MMFQTLYTLRFIVPLMSTTLPLAQNMCYTVSTRFYTYTNSKCQKSVIVKYSNNKMLFI